jgi:hypothetical protein
MRSPDPGPSGLGNHSHLAALSTPSWQMTGEGAPRRWSQEAERSLAWATGKTARGLESCRSSARADDSGVPVYAG